MRLPLVLLASVAVLASSASAARIAKSPRTSVMDTAQLKREIKRRQVTTADLKRRRNVPKRKRADPSSMPPTCAAGADIMTNGDFETGSLAPWVEQSATNGVFEVGAEYGYGGSDGTSSFGLSFQSPDSSSLGSGFLRQEVQICTGQGVLYRATFDLGVAAATEDTDTDNSCIVELLFMDANGSYAYLFYGSICTEDAPCALTNANGARYASFDSPVGPFFGPQTQYIDYKVTCDGSGGSGPSPRFLLDSLKISRREDA